MPIYEFYCQHCHTIYSFFSSRVNTRKRPKCPQCKIRVLSKQMSAFAVTGKFRENDGVGDMPFDENDLNILRVATRLVGLALERVEQITMAMEAK